MALNLNVGVSMAIWRQRGGGGVKYQLTMKMYRRGEAGSSAGEIWLIERNESPASGMASMTTLK